MKKNSSIIVIVLCLVLCLVFSACGQANSVPVTSAEPTPEPTAKPTPVPAPTPKKVDYEALATRLNADVDSSLYEAEATSEAENAGSTEEAAANTEPGEGLDAETVANSVVSGGIFEAGEECIIYRFWSAGIDRELIDLLGNDGTEQGAGVYSEILKSFVSSYHALQKAVSLYEPDARLVLQVVESSEATTPIIIVENGEVTYDYATERGYFIAAEDAEVVGEAPAEETSG